MKTLIRLIATAVFIALVSAAQGQTIAKGNINSTEAFYVYVLTHYSDGSAKWNRWEPWEWREQYDIRIWPGVTEEFIFIRATTQDTTRVTFKANDTKKRIKADITLNGGHLTIGGKR